MRYKALPLVAACALALPGIAQQVNYDDVAVIVNTNSDASVEIGAYFMAARNIPANRLISIAAPTTVSITPVEFAPLRAAIEDHIVQNDLLDSINYIVTTLGVPVRIDNGTCDSIYEFSKCGSFDTEIALMLGPLASSMVSNGYVLNPFNNSTVHQSRATSGIFLVTRLAAPTTAEVLSLIDRSGPGIPMDPAIAIMVGDVNNADTMPGVQQFWDAVILEAVTPANDLGLPVIMDVTDVFVDNVENVVGYVSLTPSMEPWLPTFQWAPGAIATEWFAYSGLHYDTPGVLPGYDRLSDLISRGATCAVGTVGITYASPWQYTRNMYERYLDTSYHFNAAESMYAGINWLSWTYDCVGDPKTSMVWSTANSMNEQDPEPSMVLMPNPSNGRFTLNEPISPADRVTVLDGTGRRVPARTGTYNNSLVVDITGAVPGIYHVHVKTARGRLFTARAMVQPY